MLGGIGYTWEHDAHLYYRRAMTLRALLGPSGELARARRRLALGRRAAAGSASSCPSEAEPLRAPIAGRARRDRRAAEGRAHAARWPTGGWVMPHLPRPVGPRRQRRSSSW